MAIHTHGGPGPVVGWGPRLRSTIVLLAAVALIMSIACDRPSHTEVQRAAMLTGGGNARSGQADIRKYGCNTCHEISGVPGARGLIGPSLNGVAQRYYIAGELPNTPDNLMRWIAHPRQVEPHTAMPEMDVTEQDSRDIAAYLYTLR
jgi:cytochrome c